MHQQRRSLSWLQEAEELVQVLVRLQVLEQVLGEVQQQERGLEQVLELELQLELVLVGEEQSRHRNHEQRWQASKWHRASTGCRRRFSTAGCHGQSASCQKLR
jgi:hypothetical protein